MFLPAFHNAIERGIDRPLPGTLCFLRLAMDSLVLKKTDKGLEALRTRDPALPKRLRTAFILFDGQKSVAQVLRLLPGAPNGIALSDITDMLQSGWLVLLNPSTAPEMPARGLEVSSDTAAALAALQHSGVPDHAQRYQQAYSMVMAIVGQMGLRGFRLQLALEKASGYDDLVAMLPRLRTAIDAAQMRPIEKVLLHTGAAASSADGIVSNKNTPVLIP